MLLVHLVRKIAIDKLITHLKKKASHAVDPSSSNSGGALLGDRTRFLLNPNDDGVYVNQWLQKIILVVCQN